MAKETPIVRQMFVVSGAALNIIGHGCIHGYPSVLFTQLESDGGPVKLNDHDVSWIGSMIGVVSIIGILVCPFLMSRYGRQKTHLIQTVPALIGWAIFLFANSVPLFLLARVLQGLAIGLRFPLAAILVAEYTDPKYRGVFLSTFAVSLGLGILFSHFIGMYMTWRTTALVCGFFPLLSMIVIIFSPESPGWLISKGRFDEGKKAFRWLRGSGIEQTAELETIVATQKSVILSQERMKKQMNTEESFVRGVLGSSFERVKYGTRILKKKEFYKPTIVAIATLFVFEFGGSHMFPAYGHVILQSVLDKKDPNEVNWHFTILDFLRTVCAMIATYLLKKYRRRTVLFSSGVLTVISLILVSGFVYLRELKFIENALLLDIVAMSLMVFYTLSFCSGLIPLTWVLCGEVFPLTYRTLGSTLSMSFWVPAFIISMKSAPHLFSSIGVEGSFLVNAAISAVCLSVLYVLLPETKDRTLYEIENDFKGKLNLETEKDVEIRLVEKA